VRLDAASLSRGIRGARALFVNDYEYGLVRKITGMSEAEIRQSVGLLVVTCGEKGAQVMVGAEEIHVPVVPPLAIVDPTGVGDAFRGGFLTGYGRGFPWAICGQMGALAATYCLEQTGPQGHSYSRAEFVARFRQHFDDQGVLDELIG
jgi:adenosine kinase